MFRWLKGTPPNGLREVEELFLGMLADGRHVFDLAMAARVGGADPATLVDDLNATEERTDEAERDIRRRLLVHASVHAGTELASCLLYMAVAKDAERIADLAKNMFGIAETVGTAPTGLLRDDFVRLRDDLSPMIVEAGRIFADDDRAAGERFVQRCRVLQRQCRERIDDLLLERSGLPQPAASVLTYRHLSRIGANLLNIVSAVVVPLDRLDYPRADGSLE